MGDLSPGADTLFAAGIVGLVWYVFGLRIAHEAPAAMPHPARSQVRRPELAEV